jgi:hypothetical protein
MRYALLLYQDKAFEAEWDALGDEAQAKVREEFGAFVEAATAAGATIHGGNELGLSHTATTVRREATAVDRFGDEITITDGPFAEVAEHLGGYFEIEARDLDHAIEIAKLVPNGTTEIRPVVEDPEAG